MIIAVKWCEGVLALGAARPSISPQPRLLAVLIVGEYLMYKEQQARDKSRLKQQEMTDKLPATNCLLLLAHVILVIIFILVLEFTEAD